MTGADGTTAKFGFVNFLGRPFLSSDPRRTRPRGTAYLPGTDQTFRAGTGVEGLGWYSFAAAPSSPCGNT